MTSTFHFIDALDVLMPRGNRAFGDAGEHGEAMALPWPSVLAGALRSSLLGADRGALAAFAQRPPQRPSGALGQALGTPAEPGSFRVSWLSLATRDAAGKVAPVLPLPADRVAFDAGGRHTVRALRPRQWPAGVYGSGSLPLTALLRGAPDGKPHAGWLVGLQALRAYLHDDALAPDAAPPQLCSKELRLGIGLDPATRTAADGALYTTEAWRYARRNEYRGAQQTASAVDAGLLVGVQGARDLLPQRGLLRLGGDGRGARHESIDNFEPPAPPLDRIARDARFRLVLLTPTLWPDGWLPAGVLRDGADLVLQLEGLRTRLACAALGRPEVISGWDLATGGPKPAQRAVPAGSVYWFDCLQGDPRKLAAWVDGGVWPDNADMTRRAEGFNNALLAAWPREE